MSFSLFRTVFRKRCQQFAGIPGPEPIFPVGTTLDFLHGQPWEVCASYVPKFGGLTLIWLGPTPALVVNDPELLFDIFERQRQDYYKDAPGPALAPVIMPGNLFTSNEPRWASARQQHPLSKVDMNAWLSRQAAALHPLLLSGLQDWIKKPASRPVDLHDEMQSLAWKMFSKSFWGEVLSDGHFRWFKSLARVGSRRMFVAAIPPVNPWFLWSRRQWYRTLTQRIRDVRQQPDPTDPSLLQTVLPMVQGMPDFVLADSMGVDFFGGVFSCSSTINTALYLLAQHPEEATKLKADLATFMRPGQAPDFDALVSCPRLDWVMREAMRYYPAVPLYFRNTVKDRSVQLGGHTIPPNTQIFISNWYLHKESDHWTDPQTFRPERWSNGGVEADPIGSGYFFPFGRGPRECIGKPFATFFIKLMLATLLTESRVGMNPSQPYKQSFFFAVMSPKKMTAIFRPVS